MPDQSRLQADLIRDEGVRLAAYQDTRGFWTIGCGHLLGAHPRMTVITMDEMYALLVADTHTAEIRAQMLLGADTYSSLDEVRQRALVNMAFNLGGHLGEFHHFLAAIVARDWKVAGMQMTASAWWTQVGERAKRLRTMIETGEDA